jgi:archaemetzincin
MIHLLPIGEISGSILEGLSTSLQKVLGVPVVVHEPVSLPASSFDSARRQYLSTPILKSLARFKSSLTQVERVLGIVDVDLYATDLNFVFGEADPKEGVAVISLARLKQEFYGLPPNESLFQERMLKEAVHELGHTYSLGHCPDPSCVMYFSNSLQDTDKKSAAFCSVCQSRQSAQIKPQKS